VRAVDQPDHQAAPRWALLTVWGVVNAVTVLQTVGFATRPVAPEVNQVVGLVMAVRG
jgi:hypothetical protein